MTALGYLVSIAPTEAGQSFKNRQELQAYLLALNDYYALMARPRFGRSRSKRQFKYAKRIKLDEDVIST